MYSVYIDGILLPVTPGRINTKIKNRNKTMELLEGGEITIIKEAGLTEIDFEALLPNVKYPFAQYSEGFKSADYYLTKLESLKGGGAPFYFYVSRIGPGSKLVYGAEPLRVSLEDYSITEDAENGIDVVVKITLKKYVDYGIKRVTLVSTQATPKGTIKTKKAASRPAPTPPRTYKVKTGDTLWKICRKEMGEGNKYKQVAKLNNIVNPNKISVGQVIRLV